MGLYTVCMIKCIWCSCVAQTKISGIFLLPHLIELYIVAFFFIHSSIFISFWGKMPKLEMIVRLLMADCLPPQCHLKHSLIEWLECYPILRPGLLICHSVFIASILSVCIPLLIYNPVEVEDAHCTFISIQKISHWHTRQPSGSVEDGCHGSTF